MAAAAKGTHSCIFPTLAPIRPLTAEQMRTTEQLGTRIVETILQENSLKTMVSLFSRHITFLTSTAEMGRSTVASFSCRVKILEQTSTELQDGIKALPASEQSYMMILMHSLQCEFNHLKTKELPRLLCKYFDDILYSFDCTVMGSKKDSESIESLWKKGCEILSEIKFSLIEGGFIPSPDILEVLNKRAAEFYRLIRSYLPPSTEKTAWGITLPDFSEIPAVNLKSLVMKDRRVNSSLMKILNCRLLLDSINQTMTVYSENPSWLYECVREDALEMSLIEEMGELFTEMKKLEGEISGSKLSDPISKHPFTRQLLDELKVDMDASADNFNGLKNIFESFSHLDMSAKDLKEAIEKRNALDPCFNQERVDVCWGEYYSALSMVYDIFENDPPENFHADIETIHESLLQLDGRENKPLPEDLPSLVEDLRNKSDAVEMSLAEPEIAELSKAWSAYFKALKALNNAFYGNMPLSMRESINAKFNDLSTLSPGKSSVQTYYDRILSGSPSTAQEIRRSPLKI